MDNSNDAVARDRLPRGVDSPRARVTEADVIEMRRMYRDGEEDQFSLAKRFKIAQTTVSAIIRRKNWRHVA